MKPTGMSIHIESSTGGSTEWCGIHHKKGRRGRAGRCGVFPRAEEPIAKADTRSHPRLRNRWFADSPQEGYALQTLTENPYGAWREYDAEDTLRFYALRLHELGMIMSTECERG